MADGVTSLLFCTETRVLKSCTIFSVNCRMLLMLQTGDTHEVSAEDWRNNATSQKVGLPATVVM